MLIKTNAVRPKNMSNYAILHLAQHLHGANRKKLLYQLLIQDPTWLKIKFSQLGGKEYLDDLDLAISDFKDPLNKEQTLILIQLVVAKNVAVLEAKSYSVKHLRLLIRLGRMNLNTALSFARAFPGEIDGRYEAIIAIYQELNELGINRLDLLDEAYEAIKPIDNRGWRANYLGKLGELFFKAGQHQKSMTVFEEAKEAASVESRTHGVDGGYSFLANKLASINQFEDAIKLARKISLSALKSSTIKSIVVELTNVGRLIEAEQLIKEISEPEHISLAVSTIANQLAKAGRYAEAEVLANKIPEPFSIASAYGKIAANYYHIHEETLSTLMVNKMYEVIQQIIVPENKINSLLELTLMCSEFSPSWDPWPILREVIEQARLISDNSRIKAAIDQIVNAMMKILPIADAEAFAVSMGNSYLRSAIEKAVSFAYIREGELKKVREILSQEKDKNILNDMTRELTSRYSLAGNITEAINLVQELGSADTRSYLLENMITTLMKEGKYGDAFSIFEYIRENPDEKTIQIDSNVLIKIITLLSENDFKIGLKHLELIDDPAVRVRALCVLAVKMHKDGMNADEVFRSATQLINNMPPKKNSPHQHNYLIKTLVESLTESGRLELALKGLDAITDEGIRNQARLSIVRILTKLGKFVDAKNIAPSDDKIIESEIASAEANWLISILSFEEAEKRLRLLPKEGNLILTVLLNLAVKLSDQGEIRRAESLLLEIYEKAILIKYDDICIEFLIEFALVTCRNGYQDISMRAFEFATQKAVDFKQGRQKPDLLENLAKSMVEAGFPNKANYVWSKAEESAFAIETVGGRDDALVSIGCSLADVGEVDEALRIGQSVTDGTNIKYSIQRYMLRSGRFCESILFQELNYPLFLWNFLISYMETQKDLEYNDKKNIIIEMSRIMGWNKSEWHKVYLTLTSP